MTMTRALAHDPKDVRKQLFEALERVRPALGATDAAELPDAKTVRGQLRRNGIGLAIGVIGAASALGALRLTMVGSHGNTALMVVLIGLAFAGLALVALLGLAGAWLENFAVARLVLMQSRLDTAEATEVAVASVDGLTALREIRTWHAPAAQKELTDAVVVFVNDRLEGVPSNDLRVRYLAIAALAKQTAPSEAAAASVLRHLRPPGVNWPTDVAATPPMEQRLVRG